jgi:hypothetical protein
MGEPRNSCRAITTPVTPVATRIAWLRSNSQLVVYVFDAVDR